MIGPRVSRHSRNGLTPTDMLRGCPLKGSTTIKAIPQRIANGPPQKSKLKTDVFESRNTRKLFTSWARMENAGCSKRFPLRIADGPRLVRCAGWPDDRPVWTESCPCQPFSAAGKRKGTADERHLWPSFFRLISQCRPDVIFGEQVASPDGLAWLDIISSDLEAAHYACGAVDTCAAGFGAPHIRQRLYWVADADGEQLHRSWFRKSGGRAEFADGGGVIGLADTAFCGSGAFYGQPGKGVQQQKLTGGYSFSDGLGNTVGKGLEGYAGHGDGEAGRQKQDRSTSTAGSNDVPLPTDGFWQNADWLLCRDGKWRPVEPGSCPLAHGTTARVGRLRGYGNAIVAPQAEAFIRAFMEWKNADRRRKEMAGEAEESL